MTQEESPPLRIQEGAKSALNKAENAWRRTLNSLNNLRRERLRTKGVLTDAELDAERAYDLATTRLEAAREHWRFIQCTVVNPKARHSSDRRTAGLHKDMIGTSDDFDEPLGDEFWLGDR